MADDFDPTDTVDGTRGRSGFLRVAGWATALSGSQQLLSLLLGLVLAGMLGPSAYGVVAIAMVYIAFLEMLQRQGLVVAVVQRPRLDSNHANAAFWFVMALSTLLTLISVALAGWWANLTAIPELRPVIIALSLTLPLQGLNVVQEALLRRQMRFRALTLRTTTAVIVGGAAGIAAAVAGWGVWALVCQQLVTAAWSTVALWLVSDWRPGVRFTRAALRDLLGFSGGTFLSSLGLFLNGRADVLISGLFFGPVSVGLYRLAARLVDAVLSLSGRSSISMALPELSPLQAEPEEFLRRGARLSKMTGVLAFPVLGVMFGAAEVIIAMLGPEWAAAADGLRWLCAYGVFRTLVTLNGPMLMALGRTYLQAAFTWAMAVVGVGVYITTALVVVDFDAAVQVSAISASRAIVFGPILLVSHLWMVARVVGMTPRAALSPFGSSLVAGVTAAVAARGLEWIIMPTDRPILAATGVCLVAALVGLAALGSIDPDARQLASSAGRRLLRGRTI